MKNYLLLFLVISSFAYISCDDDNDNPDRISGIAPTSVSMSGAVDISADNDSITLTAKVLPVNVSNPLVSWSVDNESIATIDEKGVLKALANGTVVVTSTTNGTPSVTDSKTIVISNQIVSLEKTVWHLVSKDAVVVKEKTCEVESILVFALEELPKGAPATQVAKIVKVTQSDFAKNAKDECDSKPKTSVVSVTSNVTGLVTTGDVVFDAIPGTPAVAATPGTVATDDSPGTPPTAAIPAIPAIPSVTGTYSINGNILVFTLDGEVRTYKVK